MLFPWDNAPASCMPDRCFCEFIQNDIPHQFANTYSSLIFIIFSIFILFRYFRITGLDSKLLTSNKRVFYENPQYVYIYSLSLFLIGIGSFYFHSTLSLGGQFADVSGMNFLGSFILLYHFKKIYQIKRFILTYFFLNVVLIFLLLFIPEIRRIVFGLLLILSLGILYIKPIKFQLLLNISNEKRTLPMGFLSDSEKKIKYSKFFSDTIKFHYLYIAVIVQILATVIWTLDISKIFCNPESLLQGHSLWHILCGFSAYFLYLFYESERIHKIS